MPEAAVRSSIELETRARTEVVDITDRVNQLLAGRGDGLCHLFNQHTTSALMVMTGETGVPEDIMDVLHTLVPQLAFRHDSAAHVAAHFLSGLVGPSVSVPVEDGKLCLGEFQRIVLLEFEGPRQRQIQLRLLPLAPERSR
ncbi:MAG TPA: secondary thiamine-phosphate synthase enzyme YjbQ [Methylomirabilota bacterium]|jgi:secondary thiamine-phosphate synthase enzyme|nr:secondary thiamine-phosphate synthase enzyme YjbQ [Methylomirabilota bacterium]